MSNGAQPKKAALSTETVFAMAIKGYIAHYEATTKPPGPSAQQNWEANPSVQAIWLNIAGVVAKELMTHLIETGQIVGVSRIRGLDGKPVLHNGPTPLPHPVTTAPMPTQAGVHLIDQIATLLTTMPTPEAYAKAAETLGITVPEVLMPKEGETREQHKSRVFAYLYGG